jgi:hypothetical protein
VEKGFAKQLASSKIFARASSCFYLGTGALVGVVVLTGTTTLTPEVVPPAARMPSFAATVVTNVFTIKLR